MLKCTSSQWLIPVAPKSLAHQYDVDIVFGHPQKLDEEGARGVKKLTKSNVDHHKKICRHILHQLEALEGIYLAYDERSILWTCKPLKEDINLTKAQPELDEFLQESLKDPEGVLRVHVSKTRTIDLSNLHSKRCTNANEDRSCRTVVEMVLSEHPLTRANNQFISTGTGELFESTAVPFDRGLVHCSTKVYGHPKNSRF